MTPPKGCPILMAGQLANPRSSPNDEAARCMGSRCPMWSPDGHEPNIGSCGLANGLLFADPAAPATPAPAAVTRDSRG